MVLNVLFPPTTLIYTGLSDDIEVNVGAVRLYIFIVGIDIRALIRDEIEIFVGSTMHFIAERVFIRG